MKRQSRVLLVGESCTVHTIETKGYDMFHGVRYNELAEIMKELLEKEGFLVDHIPSHRVHMDFPVTIEGLNEYDAVILSDVGANTMLLHPDTARFCKRTVNKLSLIARFVEEGGGFAMIGGYMSFMGMDGRAKYRNTIIEKVLPVELLTYDDRVEVPEGAELYLEEEGKKILTKIPESLPYILGYNKLIPKKESRILVKYEGDPIITVGHYGAGKTMAYATDCAPHWAPPGMYEWKYYGTMWRQLLEYLIKLD